MPNADLRGLDLGGKAYFISGNLQGANFAGAKLSGARFIEVDVEGANFEKANLQGVYARGAKFTNTNLLGANMINFHAEPGEDIHTPTVDFSGSNLDKVKGHSSFLTGVKWSSETSLKGSNLADSRIDSDEYFETLQDKKTIHPWEHRL